MYHHLESKNPDKYKQFKAKEKELDQEEECSSLDGSWSNQPTFVESSIRSQSLSFDHLRTKKISKIIGEMIVLDNETFTVVYHTGFNQLMKLLEPCYQLPSDKYFSEKLKQEMDEKVCLKGKEGVSAASHISITTDVWSFLA